jgi:RimJ/RimL family protein N-acetyltransferase
MASDLSNYCVHETLKDGTKVLVRAIRPDDGARVLEAFNELDRDTIYRRFFELKKELSADELKSVIDVDFDKVCSLVVTNENDESLIAEARFAVAPRVVPKSAEIAFLTGKAYRGRGIAGLLLRHLARLAKRQGISRFEADVLSDNRAMLSVLCSSGLPTQQTRDGNIVHLTLLLDPMYGGCTMEPH